MNGFRFTSMACLTATLLTFFGCAQGKSLVWNPFTDASKSREMRYDFAQVVERDGDLHKAEKAYRELSEQKPKEARYHHRLGVVLVRQGRMEEGIACLHKACELKGDDVGILNDLGYACLLKGDYQTAEKTLQQAMVVDARNPRTINNLALAVGYSGRVDESYQLFRRNGTEAEARANVAYILVQRGELNNAIRQYDQSLTKNPGNKATAEAFLQVSQIQNDMNSAHPVSSQIRLANESKYADRAPTAPKEKLARQREELVELLGDLEPASTEQTTTTEKAEGVKTAPSARTNYDWDGPGR